MRVIILLFLSIIIAYADTNLVDKINKSLKQIELETRYKSIAKLNIKYDPFYYNVNRKKVVKRRTKTYKSKVSKIDNQPLQLSMIFNKKAFINGKWYSVNQKVEQYVLTKIGQDSVVLRKKHKTIVLKIATNKKLLVKKEVR